ncbi:hypothetical protein GCM10017771_82750 [Streptomyces capitiformicae]|uniref:Cytochrome bc1 complex Rieske iron-sulfur subunit n=2 Tax=Streptomyces capitiformicae TaxID=2014920 RepID=A0A918ZLL5_9ACTN|nr:hypothetical protein GCM10017771_82750 [Streptomyces capitiformicae]
MSLRDGKAVAYFCDGRDKESWLKGDVEDDGGMKLTSKDGAELNGTLNGGSVRGTLDIGSQEYGFTADKAMGSTRRTVLATGAAATAALLVGCGEYGDEGGDTGGDTGEELAGTADIPVGGGTIFKDRKVVVTQPEEGDFKAFSAVCTHRGCIVSSVSDDTINCACHGSKFSITDGAVENGPATAPLPAEQITVSGNSIRLA